MDDLVPWLRAQLDEDERTMRAAQANGDVNDGHWFDDDDEEVIDDSGWRIAFTVDAETRAHIVRHDPARVLREIDAKRRTLIRCEEAMLSANPMLVHFAKQTAWEMALPYADRPGYRDEWRP